MNQYQTVLQAFAHAVQMLEDIQRGKSFEAGLYVHRVGDMREVLDAARAADDTAPPRNTTLQVMRDRIGELADDLGEAEALLRMVRDDLDITGPSGRPIHKLSSETEAALSAYMVQIPANNI